MSSHHFVKEKQEPAMLIAGEITLDVELTGQLLEWSPVILVHECALPFIKDFNLTIDVIFRETVNDETLTLLTNGQQNFKIVELGLPNNTIESMIKYLINENHESANVLGLKMSEVLTLGSYKNRIDLSFFSYNKKIYPIKDSFRKWMSQGQKVSINATEELEVKGLKKISGSEYSVISDGIVEIKTESDVFLTEYLE